MQETTHITVNPGALFDAGFAMGMGLGYGFLAVILLMCVSALVVAVVEPRLRAAWRWVAARRPRAS